MSRDLPLVEELTPLPEPEAMFVRLAGRPHGLFLDSAMQDPVLGRYSFLAADPFDYFEYPAGQTDGLGNPSLGLLAGAGPAGINPRTVGHARRRGSCRPLPRVARGRLRDRTSGSCERRIRGVSPLRCD